MIDIHSHVLPKVDDGSKSIEESLKMLIDAYEDGTDAIVLTPHLAYVYGFNNPKEKIIELFKQFKDIIEYEGIPISVYLGCEYLFNSSDDFINHFDDIMMINNTRYLLMEFYFDVKEEEIIEYVDMVKRAGRTPVIAHPERFEAIQIDLNVARRAICHGALLQMNKGSILGDYGGVCYETVMALLEHHYIHLVGSDAHNLTSRNTVMYESFIAVADAFGELYASKIYEKNPLLLLKNKNIDRS